MELKEIVDKTFQSERIAITDIFNAGNIFGIVYRQRLIFKKNYVVILENKIELGKSNSQRCENLENENWSGKFTIDKEGKHVKCELTNLKSAATKTIIADYISEGILISEVYNNGSNSGQGKIFEIVK